MQISHDNIIWMFREYYIFVTVFLTARRTVFSDSLTADRSDKPIRRLPVTKVNADSEDMHIPTRLGLQFFPEFIAGHGNIAGRHFRLRIFRAESPHRLFVKRNDIYNIEHLAEELHDRIPFRSIRREIQMRGTGRLDQAGAQRRTHGIEKAWSARGPHDVASPYWLIPVSQVWDTAFGARKARISPFTEGISTSEIPGRLRQ